MLSYEEMIQNCFLGKERKQSLILLITRDFLIIRSVALRDRVSLLSGSGGQGQPPQWLWGTGSASSVALRDRVSLLSGSGGQGQPPQWL